MVGYCGAIFSVGTCGTRGLALLDRSKAPELPLYVFYGYFLALLRALVTCYAAPPIVPSVYVQSVPWLSIQAQAVGFKTFFEVFLKIEVHLFLNFLIFRDGVFVSVSRLMNLTVCLCMLCVSLCVSECMLN